MKLFNVFVISIAIIFLSGCATMGETDHPFPSEDPKFVILVPTGQAEYTGQTGLGGVFGLVGSLADSALASGGIKEKVSGGISDSELLEAATKNVKDYLSTRTKASILIKPHSTTGGDFLDWFNADTRAFEFDTADALVVDYGIRDVFYVGLRREVSVNVGVRVIDPASGNVLVRRYAGSKGRFPASLKELSEEEKGNYLSSKAAEAVNEALFKGLFPE